MKLYLSSFRFGDNPEALSALIGENKRIAVIPNAKDVYTDKARLAEGLQREKDGLLQMGLTPEELDLRNYFGKSEELENELAKFGGVWVLGGNAFTLRRAYKESGMDKWLQEHKSDKEFVYAGYSAGVCVLAPSLKGLEKVDIPTIAPEGYNSEVIWDGVGLVNFAFAPHYMSDHPESEAVNAEVEYYKKNGIEYKALHDGEVIIMDTETR